VPTPFLTLDPTSFPTLDPTPPPTPIPMAFPTAEGTLDRYETRAVGEENGKPYGQVISLDPLVGYGYFEAHPLQVAERGSSTLEIFANVPDNEEDYDKGVLLMLIHLYVMTIIIVFLILNHMISGKISVFVSVHLMMLMRIMR